MDPITLSTITAALTVLATEAGKAAASEAGKSTWNQVKKLFGWSAEPPPKDLAPTMAQELQRRPELARPILDLLADERVGVAGLVGRIDAEKVVVAEHLEVHGDFNMGA